MAKKILKKKTKNNLKIWSSVFIMLIGVFLIFVVGIPLLQMLWGTIGVHIDYSEGERVGTIVKFSEKGLIWKTWEGDMVVRSGYISYGDFWQFSIDNSDPNKEKLVEAIWDAFKTGQTVQVRYGQKAGAVPWRGKTSYFIKEVRPFED